MLSSIGKCNDSHEMIRTLVIKADLIMRVCGFSINSGLLERDTSKRFHLLKVN